MKKILVAALIVGAALGLRGAALRAQQEQWNSGEEEASREIGAGNTKVFVNPADMFAEGR